MNMEIEIDASTIKRNMRPLEITKYVLKNPKQAKALANILQFVKNNGVLTKRKLIW